jgi:NitT/TauT family transport system ATP-binding protein
MASDGAGTGVADAKLAFDRVSKSYAGARRQAECVAVQDVSLQVAAGQFVFLLGPSGCGKSTLLNMAAGFIKPTSGRILVDGAPIAGPGADRGVVFQEYALFPWYTVLENVALGPRSKGLPAALRQETAERFLAMVGLGEHRHKYPKELSGGMRQRAAIARTLANEPPIILMDEPFGALDAQTRRMMQELLLDIWTRVRTTVVFITHDIDEALFLADHILVMSPRPGRIIEKMRVPFARPRRADLVVEAGFVRLKHHCLDLLRVGGHPDSLPRLSPLGLAQSVA